MNKRILYAQAVYDDAEKQAVRDSLENSWLVDGEKVREFEKQVAALFGRRFGIAVNSGSSANLLAIAALDLPRGSEVITPACTFATTVAPLVQLGLTPVFVDCLPGQYVIDVDQIEKEITVKTSALMIPHLIGGVADLKRLRFLADRHHLQLIEDSCDTLAPLFNKKNISYLSDITTTSFYGSHLITTMGAGGMIMTDSEVIRDRLRLLNNWGRTVVTTEKFEERYNYQINGIPYDKQFLYDVPGFNCKMTEAQAAFGLEQLKKLPRFIELRKHNFRIMSDFFAHYEKQLILPRVMPGAETVWLAYPLTVRDNASFTRYDLLKHLDRGNVQVRVLFSGNVLRHPAYHSSGSFPNSDQVMRGGFLIGCHQGLSTEDVVDLLAICDLFLRAYL